MSSFKILGVRVDLASRNGCLDLVRQFLHSGCHTIFTPNPEMIVKAQKDEYFKKILNSSSLNICDGRGLELAIKWKFKQKIERIPGIDFMLDICGLAEKENKSIFLLGSRSDEVVSKTASELKIKFPNLNIVGIDKGPHITEIYHLPFAIYHFSGLKIDDNDSLINKISFLNPDILFAAFGQGKQEKWIYENINKLPSIKVAMGVGGAFDYISGRVKRAPCWMRKIGVEWLYRLFIQPWRICRILSATIMFLFYLNIKILKKY